MASIGPSTIASSFERLLILPGGGGDSTNLIALTDGDAGTTFGLKLSTTDISIPATGKLYLDGGDNTYISEASGARIELWAKGQMMLWCDNEADDNNVEVRAGTFHLRNADGDSPMLSFTSIKESSGTAQVHTIEPAGTDYSGDVVLIGRADSTTSTNVVLNGNVGIGTHAVYPTGPTVGLQIFKETHVGYDDNGHDVKLFGATSGEYCKWDESRDDFVLTSGCNIGLGDTTPSYPLVIQTTGRTSIGKFISTDMSAQVFIEGGGVDDESQIVLSCKDEGSGGSRGLIRYKHNATEASQLLQIQVGDGAAQEAINIFGNGYVGIGKEAPLYALDVIGTNVDNSGNKYVARFHHDGGTGGDNDNNGIVVQAGADDGDTSSNDVIYFNAWDGDGTNIGSLTHNTSGNFVINATSDSRLKENIVDTQLDGLSLCNQIKVREFNWKDGFKGGMKNRAGFIAQEVKAVFPEAVSGTDGATKNKVTDAVYDKDRNIVEPQKIETVIDPMMVSQGSFIPILMKAIQQLSDKVTALENA